MLEELEHFDRNTINQASDSSLKDILSNVLNYKDIELSKLSDQNRELIDSVLKEIKVDPVTNRLIVPALWREELEHLLPTNFKLAKSILLSQKKKLSKDKIRQYNDVIKEQIKSGVIKPVEESSFDDNSQSYSYLAH